MEVQVQKLKSIVIDDSEVQRVTMSKIVAKHPHLNLEGCYQNAIEAKNKQAYKDIDLIFLDIEMPVINGFDLLDSINTTSQIIIVTCKSEYAIRAFEYNVTDYLLKPVDLDRFNKAIGKAMRNVQAECNLQDKAHFFVKSNFRKVRVNYSDIKWIEALGDYIKLVTAKSNHIVLTSMKAFEKELPEEQFLRIHKSYIINLKRVERLNNIMVEVDGKKMPISRQRKSRLMNALGVA